MPATAFAACPAQQMVMFGEDIKSIFNIIVDVFYLFTWPWK